VFVLPITIAPASRSRETTTASKPAWYPANAWEPYVVGRSAVSIRSLIVTGRPCSGPRGLCARLVGAQRDDRVQLRVHVLDPVEHGIHQLDRRDLPGRKLRPQVDGRGETEIVAHAATKSTRVRLPPATTDAPRRSRTSPLSVLRSKMQGGNRPGAVVLGPHRFGAGHPAQRAAAACADEDPDPLPEELRRKLQIGDEEACDWLAHTAEGKRLYRQRAQWLGRMHRRRTAVREEVDCCANR
jgi:hypothetical protein